MGSARNALRPSTAGVFANGKVDPAEAGRRGAAERERRRHERIGETRERLEVNALKAADTVIELLSSASDRERRLAAEFVLAQVLGKPDQRIEHAGEASEWTQRMDELMAEMEALEAAERSQVQPDG